MNTCNLTLSCGIQDQSVTYTWYWESGSFSKQLQSSVLEDVHTPQSYSKSYTCQVSNPISRQNSTIHFTSPCVQGKSLSQGSWGEHWVTSFLLNEEKCGDLFPLPVIEFGGESQRQQWGVVDLDSPCVSDMISQQASLAFVELSVLTCKGLSRPLCLSCFNKCMVLESEGRVLAG